MSVHVCKCTHNGIDEWHIRYPGMSQEGAQQIADKINAGWLDGRDATAAIEQARREEREACAAIAEEAEYLIFAYGSDAVAREIRARKKKK